MNKDLNDVKDYFYRSAGEFDTIYSGKKGKLLQLFDQYFRSDMYERFRLTMEYSGDLKEKTVLDLGCGSGRYSIDFAKNGVSKVVGIDLAESMLQIANRIAQENSVDNICEFNVGNIFEYQSDEPFDIVIAMGVFDYIENPLSLIEHMLSLSKDIIIASFPSYHAIRTSVRKVRYKIKKCPVYFYNYDTIEDILKKAGLIKYDIVKIKGAGMDYVVHAQKKYS